MNDPNVNLLQTGVLEDVTNCQFSVPRLYGINVVIVPYYLLVYNIVVSN